MAPTRTTSPRARWAAGASRSPSPDRAAIAGAISASAIRCTRSGRAVALFSERGSSGAPKSSINVGLIEGGSERQRHCAIGARQGGYPLRRQREDGRAGGRARNRRGARARAGKPARHRRQSDGEDQGNRLAARRGAARVRAAFCSTSARSMRTSASARTSIAPPPTPTFRSPWAFRPSPSAPAERAAARTPRRNGIAPKAAISA